MKDPHQISSAYILDPAYSKSARLPAAPGSSLYGGQPGSSQWLYGVGDVAAFLMGECAWVDPSRKIVVAADGKPRRITLKCEGTEWKHSGD